MTRLEKTLALILLVCSLIGVLYAAGPVIVRDLWGFVTRVQHEADMDRIERKLDCALWDLPSECRRTLSPRGP